MGLSSCDILIGTTLVGLTSASEMMPVVNLSGEGKENDMLLFTARSRTHPEAATIQYPLSLSRQMKNLVMTGQFAFAMQQAASSLDLASQATPV